MQRITLPYIVPMPAVRSLAAIEPATNQREQERGQIITDLFGKTQWEPAW